MIMITAKCPGWNFIAGKKKKVYGKNRFSVIVPWLIQRVGIWLNVVIVHLTGDNFIVSSSAQVDVGQGPKLSSNLRNFMSCQNKKLSVRWDFSSQNKLW